MNRFPPTMDLRALLDLLLEADVLLITQIVPTLLNFQDAGNKFSQFNKVLLYRKINENNFY